MSSYSSISFAEFSRPPPGYTAPPFPGLYWPPQVPVLHGSLYHLYDIWRFTMLWTVILYAIFHIGAALIALFVQLVFTGRPEYWRYLWTIPVVYGISAGAEALFAGSFVGLIIGAAYSAGPFWMSTWIPFIWGWVNVLIILISSFSIQGGL
ncbi:integral membrane protein [Ophiostoma piceae UAMH 11346]|uniref:Integral membrane protein n=1 Tax=Ophiostoma piceae (strain UAMH 11346) TaxID=1262450 RepID=S3CS16_OPHP1|nr:integral membrane protein [Ophiostoma piceae UAMH 11346]